MVFGTCGCSCDCCCVWKEGIGAAQIVMQHPTKNRVRILMRASWPTGLAESDEKQRGFGLTRSATLGQKPTDWCGGAIERRASGMRHKEAGHARSRRECRRRCKAFRRRSDRGKCAGEREAPLNTERES